MLREQRIMDRIVNEIGDELNEYITTFNGCDFWKVKEGEIIINKTFKRLLGIIADYNLTTVDEIIKDTSGLPDDSGAMMFILSTLADKYITLGGDSLLNRAMVFCFLLHYIYEREGKTINATEILKHSIESDLVYKKESLWQKIKFTFGFANAPFQIRGNTRAIGLMSILAGKPGSEMIGDIISYYDLM